MTNKYWVSALVCVVMLFGASVPAQPSFGYANTLFAERDYFRAISEYKKIAYFTTDASVRHHAHAQIAQAYYQSKKYHTSDYYITQVLSASNLTDSLRTAMHVLGGLNSYARHRYPRALQLFQTSRSHGGASYTYAYSGLVYATLGQLDSAAVYFQHVPISDEFPFSLAERQRAITVVTSQQTVSKKSPMLAAGLSTVLPGSGQLYAGHAYDALQAAGFVLGFSYASYLAYQYDHQVGHSYVNTGVAVSLTVLFHLGNIIGAYRTAQYANYKQRDTFLNQLQSFVLP